MPDVTVETGAIVAGANSYASEEDFAEWAGAHLYAGSYLAATDTQRQQALIMATRLIETYFEFPGVLVSGDQVLSWPRSGVARDPAGTLFATTAIPERLKMANLELAFELLKRDRTAEPETQGVQRINLGQQAFEAVFDKDDRADVIPEAVKVLLMDFAFPRNGRITRAKVRRV